MLGYVPLFLFFANICLIGSKNYRVCFNTLQQKKKKLETFLILFNFIMLKVNSSCVSYTTNNTDACVQIAIARYSLSPTALSTWFHRIKMFHPTANIPREVNCRFWFLIMILTNKFFFLLL